VKSRLVRAAERSAGALPDPLAELLLDASAAVARAAWFAPGMPMRHACHDVARLARGRGALHDPRAIHHRLVAQMRDVGSLYHQLHRAGREAVLPHLHLRPEQQRMLASLFESDGSFVIAVAHNPAAVLYAMRFAESFPCVVVGKISKRPGSNELLERFFARLEVPFVQASRHERVAFTRRLLEAADEGRAIIAPIDRIDRRKESPTARIFGSDVPFPPWALRIAARRKLPVLPAWITVERGEAWLELGEPIREADPERALQDAIARFEQWIVRDPGSWAFLADRRWRRVMRRAKKPR
jgi:hypothetical protein